MAHSVDFYNAWFIQFAPHTYRSTREDTTKQVEAALDWTDNFRTINSALVRQYPALLPILRMATAPPLARDRLIGLAKVSAHLVRSIEFHQQLPATMSYERIEAELNQIIQTLMRLIDLDIFPWPATGQHPTAGEIYRAATIVADRLCGARADPIIRNAQEQRQLAAIRQWLEAKGYVLAKDTRIKFPDLLPGTFLFRLNVPITQAASTRQVNIPIDVVIQPHDVQPNKLPLLIEAKSAGDFANTNKRRKEEALKITQLRHTYGDRIIFVLFLCGYFDSGYLGYEAAEGIDWIWEHRMDDLAQLGL